jgi:hypothetical protein
LVASLATGVLLLVAGARQLATPSSPGRTAIVPRVPVIEPYPDLPLSGFDDIITRDAVGPAPWTSRGRRWRMLAHNGSIGNMSGGQQSVQLVE